MKEEREAYIIKMKETRKKWCKKSGLKVYCCIFHIILGFDEVASLFGPKVIIEINEKIVNLFLL